MRVIAGTARGRRLFAPHGLDTRPTVDRLKETLFNILAPELPGAVFLDIFSGSGAIGIEALSRGAKSAVFIDSHRNAIDAIRKNLSNTGFMDRAAIFHMDYMRGLKKLGDEGYQFDIVFVDAPYRKELTRLAISAVMELKLLSVKGLITAETAADEEEPIVPGCSIVRTKKCGTTCFIFCRQAEEA